MKTCLKFATLLMEISILIYRLCEINSVALYKNSFLIAVLIKTSVSHERN